MKEDAPYEAPDELAPPALRNLVSALVSLNSLINHLPRESKARYQAEIARNELSDVGRMV